jgi:DNA modification methylase
MKLVNRKFEIVELSPNDLKEYEKNNKSHSEHQISILVQIMDKFGQTNDVLIDENNVILAGHARLLAVKKLGWSKLRCKRFLDLTENEKKTYRIADNRVGELAETNWSFLKEEYLDLKDTNTGLEYLTGYNEEDFNFLQEEKEVVEDDYEPPEEIKTDIKQGDIIKLGKHKLMCGDSTKEEDVKKLMNENKVDLVVTDPPYNVDYGKKNEYLNTIGKGNHIQTDIKNDNIKDFKQFCTNFLKIIPYNDYNSIYCFISGKELHNLILAFKEAELYYSQDLKWIKNNHVLGRLDYNPKSENIIYGWRNHHKFYGDFSTDVIECNKPNKSDLHPTMKPIELLSKLILNSSKEEMNVYDCFGGSGSTLIACEQTNRNCYMMELEPHYCEVICQRFEKLTGKTREYE